jgi:hypothetical protein
MILETKQHLCIDSIEVPRSIGGSESYQLFSELLYARVFTYSPKRCCTTRNINPHTRRLSPAYCFVAFAFLGAAAFLVAVFFTVVFLVVAFFVAVAFLAAGFAFLTVVFFVAVAFFLGAV